MDASATFPLTFSKTELYFVASVLHISDLVALDCLFAGQQTEEIHACLGNACRKLAGRGYLEMQPDGTLVLDATVVALVQAAAAGQRVLVLTALHRDGIVLTRYIHWTPELIVEQDVLADGRVLLTAVRDVEVLVRRCRGFAGLSGAPAAPEPALVLTEDAFREARYLAFAGDAQACRALLLEVGVPTKATAALTAALSEVQSIGSLAAPLPRFPDETQEGGLAWLAGRGGAWIVRPPERGATTAELIPTDGEEIGRRLEATLLRLCSL